MQKVWAIFFGENQAEVIPGKWHQIAAIMIVNVSSILCGLIYGWTSTMIPLFNKENNEAGIEPLTNDQFSWVVSAQIFGSLIILPFGGSFSEKFGRKTTALCMTIPALASWVTILFATNFYHILISQLLNGIFDGLSSICVPIYVTESVSDSIRGQLGTLFQLSIEIGHLAAYIIGSAIGYKTYTLIALATSIIYFIGILFIPETPVYLVRKYRIEEARRSLMWLRGNEKAAVDKELSQLQEFHIKDTEKRKPTDLSVLFKDRASRKGMLMALGIVIGDQTCGMNVIALYTVTIFTLTKTAIDPHIASISYGCSQVLGAMISSLMIERFGRRRLLSTSSIGMGICHFCLGQFLLLQYLEYDMLTFNWMPMVIMSAFGFAYNIGMGPLVFILPNELYNPDLASICSAITMFVYYSIGTLVTKFFPMLIDFLGFHTCFFIFVLSCLYIFLLTFSLSETKGKSIETIRKELSGSEQQVQRSDRHVIRDVTEL